MFFRQSPHSRKILRWGAFHFVTNYVILILCVFLLLYGLTYRSFDILRLSLGLSLLWLLSVCLFYGLFRSSTCPDCLSRIWTKKGTRKHFEAARFLGLSCRLNVAVSVLLRRKYQCPDCGQLFHCRKKIKRHSPPEPSSSV